MFSHFSIWKGDHFKQSQMSSAYFSFPSLRLFFQTSDLLNYFLPLRFRSLLLFHLTARKFSSGQYKYRALTAFYAHVVKDRC